LNYLIVGSLAALFQGLGRADDALQVYSYVMPLLPNDAGLMNNYGALLGTMNRHDESLSWLQASYARDPNMLHTLINLGSHYQDESMIDVAHSYFQRAVDLHPHASTTLLLRMHMLISPVSKSWPAMSLERNELIHNLTHFVRDTHVNQVLFDSSLDRVPFYVSYHGILL
jgi:Tfp pilus assembly protein PilF